MDEGIDGCFKERVGIRRFRQGRVELQEGGRGGLALVREKIDKPLVSCEMLATVRTDAVGTPRTFQKALVLSKFRRVIELAEVLCLLGEILALDECITLLSDDVRCGTV